MCVGLGERLLTRMCVEIRRPAGAAAGKRDELVFTSLFMIHDDVSIVFQSELRDLRTRTLEDETISL